MQQDQSSNPEANLEKQKKQIQKTEQKEIAEMAGIDTSKTLLDLQFTQPQEFKLLVDVLSLKLKGKSNTEHISDFVKQLLEVFEHDFRVEELTELSDFVNVMAN